MVLIAVTLSLLHLNTDDFKSVKVVTAFKIITKTIIMKLCYLKTVLGDRFCFSSFAQYFTNLNINKNGFLLK